MGFGSSYVQSLRLLERTTSLRRQNRSAARDSWDELNTLAVDSLEGRGPSIIVQRHRLALLIRSLALYFNLGRIESQGKQARPRRGSSSPRAPQRKAMLWHHH